MTLPNIDSDLNSSKIYGKRFEFLDGLRGIAALLVVLLHFGNLLKESFVDPFPTFIDWMLSQGHLGVEIFFILSGFVITYSLRNQLISFDFFINFFIKRSIRLDFPYWFTLFILLLLSILGNIFKSIPYPLPGINEVLINLFYLAEILEVPRILPVSWTLSLEIQFYLFLILVIKSIQYLNSRFFKENNNFFSLPSLVFLAFLMVVSLLQNTSYHLIPQIPGLFVYRWYSFFIGCLICWRMLNLITPYFFWLNFGLLGSYALSKDLAAFETCLVALIIYSVAIAGKMHDYLTSSLFQYLGKISYSLYLIHWVIGLKIMDLTIRFFKSSIDENPEFIYLLLIFALMSTLFIADVFYRMIEWPSLRWSRRIKKPQPIFSSAAV